jgi:hypothetical protein
MRRNAIQLLQLIAPENLRYSPLPIDSLLDVTYRRSQVRTQPPPTPTNEISSSNWGLCSGIAV